MHFLISPGNGRLHKIYVSSAESSWPFSNREYVTSPVQTSSQRAVCANYRLDFKPWSECPNVQQAQHSLKLWFHHQLVIIQTDTFTPISIVQGPQKAELLLQLHLFPLKDHACTKEGTYTSLKTMFVFTVTMTIGESLVVCWPKRHNHILLAFPQATQLCSLCLVQKGNEVTKVKSNF